jgi:2-polyprenyl-3-methyl-5-hydroxy-6-metoxy-1,4-benzoquinol methylase
MSEPEPTTSPTETDFDFRQKYESKNPILRYLIDRFYDSIGELLRAAEPRRVLEVGCGEGFSTARLRELLPAQTSLEACDVEHRLVAAARQRNPGVAIHQESIYDTARESGGWDLVVCMEVLEHLDRPEDALKQLVRLSSRWLLVSVPREPLWRAMNMARLTYLADWGNTPGHIQHWSTGGFRRFVGRHAQPHAVHTPVPWTQVLARVDEGRG